jgi:hypothetical protein
MLHLALYVRDWSGLTEHAQGFGGAKLDRPRAISPRRQRFASCQVWPLTAILRRESELAGEATASSPIDGVTGRFNCEITDLGADQRNVTARS